LAGADLDNRGQRVSDDEGLEGAGREQQAKK
jgi:hypothetical protein